MKTSKIIFVSLLGTIALIILAGFIVVRFAVKKNEANMFRNKKPIPAFKVLYLTNSNINLSYCDSTYLAATGEKDFTFSEINYKIINDTLKITDVRNSRVTKLVNIYSTDSLKNIVLINSYLFIDKYGQKNLALEMDSSNVTFRQGKKEEFSFNSLNINARKHSTVSADDFKTDNLIISLEKSEAQIYITSRKIIGSLSDSSSFTIRQSDDISLKKDSSSRINMNF
jgi:hypothetical protein